MCADHNTKMCVQIPVRDGDRELIWLKAFTFVLKEIVKQPAPDPTLQSPGEDIYDHFFDLRNATLKYSGASGIIKAFYLESV